MSLKVCIIIILHSQAAEAELEEKDVEIHQKDVEIQQKNVRNNCYTHAGALRHWWLIKYA